MESALTSLMGAGSARIPPSVPGRDTASEDETLWSLGGRMVPLIPRPKGGMDEGIMTGLLTQ